MKTKLSYLLGMALLLACSAPKKYSYHFDHYQYKTATKSSDQITGVESIGKLVRKAEQAERATQSEQLLASQTEMAVVAGENPIVVKAEGIADKYQQMTKAGNQRDKKTLKREIKQDIRSLKKDVKSYLKEKRTDDSVTSTKAMDRDLKMSLIFLALSLVGSIFFWLLGAILFIVAVVFFIMWLSRQ
ncbi:MAG: hypothetical protein AB7K37_04440 [Cyclobacteriaceae bacterium]